MLARQNPFSSDRILRIRYRLQEASWEELMRRLGEMKFRAAIVGPEGSGKTTLLDELAQRLAELGLAVRRACLRRGQSALARGEMRRLLRGLTARDVVLFDGANHLSWWRWKWFAWRCRPAGLVVTSHRVGLLPALIRTSTSAGLLRKLVTELIGEEAAGIDVDTLYGRHRGNLRSALRELYDHYAAR